MLNSNELEEIARVGYTKLGYEVYIVTDDNADKPHFHYRKEKENYKFHSCIRLDSAEYFCHTGNEKKLNAKQIRDLVNFLNNKPEKAIEFSTNWHFALILWNCNNYNLEIDKNLVMPDYGKLK